MKPEHLDWLEAIWSRLSQVTDEVLGPASQQRSVIVVHVLKRKICKARSHGSIRALDGSISSIRDKSQAVDG